MIVKIITRGKNDLLPQLKLKQNGPKAPSFTLSVYPSFSVDSRKPASQPAGHRRGIKPAWYGWNRSLTMLTPVSCLLSAKWLVKRWKDLRQLFSGRTCQDLRKMSLSFFPKINMSWNSYSEEMLSFKWGSECMKYIWQFNSFTSSALAKKRSGGVMLPGTWKHGDALPFLWVRKPPHAFNWAAEASLSHKRWEGDRNFWWHSCWQNKLQDAKSRAKLERHFFLTMHDGKEEWSEPTSKI